VSGNGEAHITGDLRVRGLPAVFDTKRRPWITPDAAAADEVVTQVKRCPSGALQYEHHEAE